MLKAEPSTEMDISYANAIRPRKSKDTRTMNKAVETPYIEESKDNDIIEEESKS